MKKFILMISLLLVAACGFEPMYGRNQDEAVGVENRLAVVDINNIPDREGQYLRNALIDRFYRRGRPQTPLYILNIEPLIENLVDLDITKNSDATRGQLKLESDLQLTDAKTGEIVMQRKIAAITSYNILGSEFATRVSEENARTNALEDLARQVELQLNLYFKTK